MRGRATKTRPAAAGVFGIGSLLLAGLLAAPATAAAQGDRPPGSDYEGRAFEFVRITDDVYHAVGTGALAVVSNAAVVINEHDVLLVDSHVSPAAADALLRELKRITDKPVRYVVNTHFHFDHAHGNQVYPPEVQIIGHEFTREMLASGRSVDNRAHELFIGGIPDRIAELRSQLEDTDDPEERAELRERIAYQERYRDATDAVVPTPPNTTLARRLVLHRGDREIRILFFGRGHTGGDVVVHLPREGILATGDLLLPGLPYMGNGYFQDWVRTLEHLKELEFDTVLPGHGRPFEDRARIDHLQAYLTDFRERAVRMHEEGVPAEEAAGRIDMTDHAEHYPQIDGPGVHPHAVIRLYELLDGRER